MAETSQSSRLSHGDPWTTVNEARQQRGRVMAAWLVARVPLLCSIEFWRARFGATRRLSVAATGARAWQ